MNKNWFQSKTVWGTIIILIAQGLQTLCSDHQLCLLPDQVLMILTYIGTILGGGVAATGLRDAIAKNGQGK